MDHVKRFFQSFLFHSGQNTGEFIQRKEGRETRKTHVHFSTSPCLQVSLRYLGSYVNTITSFASTKLNSSIVEPVANVSSSTHPWTKRIPTKKTTWVAEVHPTICRLNCWWLEIQVCLRKNDYITNIRYANGLFRIYWRKGRDFSALPSMPVVLCFEFEFEKVCVLFH